MAWPSDLESLSFGCVLSLEGATLPSGLQSLSLSGLRKSLEGVAWPSGLQSIAFSWSGALKRVNWPSTLQCLVVCGPRSEVVKMDLPWGLQRFECKFQEDEEEWVISTVDKKHGCQ